MVKYLSIFLRCSGLFQKLMVPRAMEFTCNNFVLCTSELPEILLLEGVPAHGRGVGPIMSLPAQTIL